MSNFNLPAINHLALGELSRRKLHKVAMLPSDTLRRAVLIHNIVRSTASLPPSPISPQSESQSEPAYDYCPPSTASYSEEAHDYSRDAPAASAVTASEADSDSDMFVFPSSAMTSSAVQEQIWLDSLLDDLEAEAVHVSVVEADDEASEGEVEDQYPLFAGAATPCTSSPPPASPSVRPTMSYRHQQTSFSDPASPPRSPPELDAHSFSDDDEDDYMDDSDGDDEAVTPTSSTEIGSSDSYFFGPLPFHCHFQLN